MLAVLVRWLSSGGLRHIAADRHGHRDPHAALESLEQALLLTVADVARVAALALLAGLLVAAALTAVRLIGRRRWRYRRYAIAPYRTDDATPEQVLALFQDWHQQIHQRLHRRLLFGQPYLALEEHAQPSDGGPEMTMTIVCPEQFVAALDGRLAATYPHSRIGHAFTRRFEPLELDIALAPRDRPAAQAPPLHRHRQDRHARVRPARDRGRAGGDGRVRASDDRPEGAHADLPGVRARRALALPAPRAPRRPPRRAPARSAPPRRSRRPRCAPRWTPRTSCCSGSRRASSPASHAACRMVAGAIAGRRQENMLRQRNTSFTRGLHRRRVALARPEAIPSWRNGVISAAEAATLWQLPSPRIGHIRLARHTIPRAPAPPDVARARSQRRRSDSAGRAADGASRGGRRAAEPRGPRVPAPGEAAA